MIENLECWKWSPGLHSNAPETGLLLLSLIARGLETPRVAPASVILELLPLLWGHKGPPVSVSHWPVLSRTPGPPSVPSSQPATAEKLSQTWVKSASFRSIIFKDFPVQFCSVVGYWATVMLSCKSISKNILIPETILDKTYLLSLRPAINS